MNQNKNIEPSPPAELQNHLQDYIITGAKVLGAAVPFGSVIAEIISCIIPDQRVDRIVKFLGRLDERVKPLEKAVQEKLKTTGFTDLLEDGMFQAVRALTDERREYIINCLVNSLTPDELQHIHYKMLLDILSRLNDAEIITLKYYSMIASPEEQREYWEKHRSIIFPPVVVSDTPPEVADKATIMGYQKEKLIQLGLLHPTFRKPSKGESPEFDLNTGMIKAYSYRVTQLGRLLIRVIGI